MTMRIVVPGGTGFVGKSVVAALCDAGHEVTIASRSKPPKAEPRARWVRADVIDPPSLASALSGAEAVVDAVQFPNSPIENPKKGLTFERIDLQGTRNLVDAARSAGVRRFIGLSGVGASPDAPFHWLRFKWQEEQHILDSGLDGTIFRPSWVYGPEDVSLNRFLGFARFLPFVPVIGDGKTRINPLLIDDLAAHVAAALVREDLAGRVFEIGGPEVLTMDDVIRVALKVSGRRRVLMHQPVWLMKLVARVVQHVPGRPLTPGAVDFITMDGVADIGPLMETFGLQLTPIERGLATYLTRPV
jgi:NADH dehydrogenase